MKAEKDSPRESPEDTGARASGGATEETGLLPEAWKRVPSPANEAGPVA